MKYGNETIVEGDDAVIDYYGTLYPPIRFELLSKEDLSQYAWVIYDQMEPERILHLNWKVTEQDKPDPQIIYFDDYSSAEEFLKWVKQSPGSKAGGKIICKMKASTCKPLQNTDKKNLKIKFEAMNNSD